MAQITLIEPQKKSASQRTKRFNIFLDGVFAFGADEDLVVSERLIPGKNISQKELEKLLYEASVGKLMERMYGLFSVRQRSEKEVRDYFKIKNLKFKIQNEEGISDLAINAVVEKLKEKGMINDLEFAKAWVEGRRRSKNKSIRALKMELMKKGMSREIIEEVLRLADARSGQVSEEDLAKLALEKKMKIWKNLDQKKLYQKSIEFLLRRGFDYEIIKTVLDKQIDNP